MPEILPDHVPSPRTALFWDGTAYRPGTIDAGGHIQIDVLSTAMDPLAATAAAQALALAQLQLIEDMRDALQSVATDRLIVRGEDQLFSYEEPVSQGGSGVISGAGGFFASPVVPANRVWKVTHVCGYDTTNPVTEMDFYSRIGGVSRAFEVEIRAIAAGEVVCTPCEIYLGPTDSIRIYFIGALAGDTVAVHVHGYQMTLET